MAKIVNFGDFLKTWCLLSNSVTRQVTFNWTKIIEKCHNWNATFLVTLWIGFKLLPVWITMLLKVPIRNTVHWSGNGKRKSWSGTDKKSGANIFWWWTCGSKWRRIGLPPTRWGWCKKQLSCPRKIQTWSPPFLKKKN